MRLLDLIETITGWPTLYHGSDQHFQGYDLDQSRGSGQFIFTTANQDAARSYGEKVSMVIPQMSPTVLDLLNPDDETMRILEAFLRKQQTFPSVEELWKVIKEGRMFVKDEYGNLQASLLEFCFSFGYNCVIIRDQSYGMNKDERTWVFSDPSDLKFSMIEATTGTDQGLCMTGGCFALALALHKRSRLPIYGLYDNGGNIHHAFVKDGDYGIDARGRVPIRDIRFYRGRPSAGQHIRPVTQRELERLSRLVDPVNMAVLNRVSSRALTERRQQRTSIMYHGTSTAFLRSILKQGLLANPPTRVYTGDENDPGPIGYKTFGGIYLADNQGLSSNGAIAAVDKFGGQQMEIEVQYVHGSGNMDEDKITVGLVSNIRASMDEFYQRQEDGAEEYQDFDSFTDYERADRRMVVHEIMVDAISYFEKTGNLNKTFEPALEKAIHFILDHVDEEHIESSTHMTTLRDYDEFVKLVEIMMSSIDDNPMKIKSVQITRDIGFRGKTRIIKITNVDTSEVYYQAQQVDDSHRY